MDGDRRSPTSRNGQTVHWVIAVLLAIIATCLVMDLDGGRWVAKAQAQTPRIGARGIFAFAGQIGARSYGLYMVDTEAGNLWCYEYARDKGKLRLLAARSFLYDRCLEEFNVDSPTPREVAQLVKRLEARKRGDDGKTKNVQEK